MGKPKFLLFLTKINKIFKNNTYNVYYKDGKDRNLLHLICMVKNQSKKHLECIKILYNFNPLIIDEVDSYGRTPLFYAAINSSIDIFSYLVYKSKNRFLSDNYGWYIIHYVNNIDKVYALKRYNTDVVDTKTDYDRYTLLILSSKQNNIELIRGLIDIGAELTSVSIFFL